MSATSLKITYNRELDALVAEHLFGWHRLSDGATTYINGSPLTWADTANIRWQRVKPGFMVVSWMPYFTTSMNSSWRIVNWLTQQGWFVSVKTKPSDDFFSSNDGDMIVRTAVLVDLYRRHQSPYRLFAADDRPGVAIALAALNSLDIEVKWDEPLQ